MWMKGTGLVMERENWIKWIQWGFSGSSVLSIEDVSQKENIFCCKRAEDLDRLMFLIKEKVTSAKTEGKAKLLTLVPDSWTLKEIEEFLHLSNKVARNSQVLTIEKGLLPKAESRRRKVLLEEIRDRIINFSGMYPGKKEFLSVKIEGVKQHMQKRLLLINLKKLHLEFKKAADIKIGFSKFCKLWPKLCIPVSSVSRAHSVCVCEYH